ncbi:M56 family metallopeptidase [Granulicella sp. WH15]|uniref:M56 family metallopeptidase n=1 Tax=Granulicella sp. WH15 TaxID=2602070 RepID=UPI0013670464|nr:M56 family metallopeptidase [Granulicella sp. WH15]QHN04337.1 M56 family metallopeptidase [Granulicella sp. WH15]
MSYTLRLACACLASFFLVHVAASLLILALSSVATRLAVRMRASSGALLLFGLRLLPLTLSTLTVLLFCIPSYLRFEQDASESIGYPCLAFAAAGAALIAAAAMRFVWALFASHRIAQDEASPRIGIRSPFTLVGFLHPRLIVSHRARQALSQSQMEAALLHEEAHRQSYDNLKRLAMVSAPGVLPLHPTFRSLEQQWARMAEWAADDAAVASEPMRAIALAEALVRVARLSTRSEQIPVVSSLVACKDDLGERVQRLLGPTAQATPTTGHSRLRTAAVATAAAIITLLATHQREVLSLVHSAMEFLVH